MVEITTKDCAVVDTPPPKKMISIQSVKCLDLVETEHVPIHQHGYGRMDRNFPHPGLCTFGLAACLGIVVHCPATGRTIVSHSPNYMIIADEFTPIISWVLDEGTSDVYIKIVRGREYLDSESSKDWGHDGFVRDFRQQTKIVFDSTNIQIEDCAVISSAGAITVDKISADIRILQNPRQYAVLRNAALANQWTRSQAMRAIYCRVFAQVRNEPVKNVIQLQYDQDHYVISCKMLDEERQFYRSLRSGEPQEQLITALSQKYPTSDITHFCAMIHSIQDPVPSPCDNCGADGPKLCMRCRGAWYCSRACQEADFPSHKKWCRQHAVK